MGRRAPFGRAWVAAALLALASAAEAGEPPLRIVGDSQGCPSPSAVAARLGALVPAVNVAIGAVPGPSRSTVLLWNEGAQWSVTVQGKERVVDGRRQTCAERARAAAVIVALALFPPSFPAPLPEPSAQPPVAAAPELRREGARPSRWRFALDAAALLDTAPFADGGAASAAAFALRFFAGGERWGAIAGVGAVAWSDARAGGVAWRARRFPFDLGARGAWPVGPWIVTAELGLALGVLEVTAPGLAPRSDEARLEVGARAAIALRWPLSFVTPFVGLEGAFFPRPFELSADPIQRFASTPWARLGVSLGVEIPFAR